MKIKRCTTTFTQVVVGPKRYSTKHILNPNLLRNYCVKCLKGVDWCKYVSFLITVIRILMFIHLHITIWHIDNQIICAFCELIHVDILVLFYCSVATRG